MYQESLAIVSTTIRLWSQSRYTDLISWHKLSISELFFVRKKAQGTGKNNNELP